MMNLQNKKCLVIDYGSYISIAQRLSRDDGFGTIFYHVPLFHNGFPTHRPYDIGRNVEGITKVDEWASVIDDVDIVVFPDVYEGELQLYFQRIGKPVFGSKMAGELEYDRVLLKNKIEELGLPINDYWVAKGVDELESVLKQEEKVHVKSRLRGDCFDEETEIFTSNGWKKFNCISFDDVVLSMNLHNREACYCKINEIIKKRYEGEMYRIFSNKGVDALVTPNHHFWMNKTPRVNKWEYLPISNPKASFIIPRTFVWNEVDVDNIIISNSYKDDRYKNRKSSIDKIIPMDIWAEWLGWFIGEGSLVKRNNRYRVIVSQSKKVNKVKSDKIKTLFKEMGYNPQDDITGWSAYDKSLFDKLCLDCYIGVKCETCNRTHCCHQKIVPSYIKNLSSRQIKIFLKSYREADGCKNGELDRFYTSSKQLADDIQELIFKTGNSASIKIGGKKDDIGGTNNKGKKIINRCDSYVITEGKNVNVGIKQKNISKINYEGFIYDVTVDPYHTILVRRNYSVYWSGNSETWESKNYRLSKGELNRMRTNLGAYANEETYVVESHIESVGEIGIDTFCINGDYPSECMTGIEIKDTGYGCKIVKYDSLPIQLKRVTDKFSDTFRELKYCGAHSNEVIISEDRKGYLIDLTQRFGQPPSDLMCEIYTNFPEIIWMVANGITPTLEYKYKYGIQLIIKSETAKTDASPIIVPDEYKDFVKIKNLTIDDDGVWYYTPLSSDLNMCEIGSIVSCANTMREAINMATKIADSLQGFDIKINTDCIDEVRQQINRLKDIGIHYLE